MTNGPTTAAGDRLSVRDLITIGMLSLLLVILMSVIMTVVFLVPVLFPFGMAFVAIPGGVIGMLLLARVAKPGVILIWGATLAVMMVALGFGAIPPIALLVAALVGELLYNRLGRHNFGGMAVGYGSLIVGIAVGSNLIFAFSPGVGLADAAARGNDPGALAAMMRFISPGMLPVIGAVAFGGAWLGAMLGRRLLRKHFERAGKV